MSTACVVTEDIFCRSRAQNIVWLIVVWMGLDWIGLDLAVNEKLQEVVRSEPRPGVSFHSANLGREQQEEQGRKKLKRD